MLYKGLGCRQSYSDAITYFSIGANLNDLGSMFMLGYCYRNGYGVENNASEAKKWLEKAAFFGYKPAKDELLMSDAENRNLINTISFTPTKKNITWNALNFDSIKNVIPGTYKGEIITYDWSGLYAIEKDSLTITLAVNATSITGKWNEAGNPVTDVIAQITDSALIFNQTIFRKTDRFKPDTSIPWQLKNNMVQLIKNDSVVSIIGSLQMYSVELKEPWKPTMIVLTKINHPKTTHNL